MNTGLMTGRRRRVAAAAKKAGAPALLLTNLADVRYLTGFTGSNGALLLVGTKATFFTDGRYTTQAAGEVDGASVVIAEQSLVKAALEMAVELGVAGCGFDSATTTVAGLEAMRAIVPGKGYFVAAPGLIAGLREVKDEVEQDRMRAAAALGCRLFDQVLEHVVPGATEMEVAMALEYMARLEGAEGMSFESIVAVGERSALPHGRATTAKLPRRGFVTLDFGVVLDGYCSDMTRTVHMGAARKGEREVYEAVLEAQEAGVAAVRAGVLPSDVDEAARGVLERAGLAEYFTHSTGHGVGVEIHEGPRLGKKREGVEESRLKAGMIVTIEPGVYLPGKYGVRIEDTVLVTAGRLRSADADDESLDRAVRRAWMDGNELKDLRELVEFLKANDIAEFGLEKEGLKVNLKFQGTAEAAAPAAGIDMAQLARLMASAPAAAPAAAAAPAGAPAAVAAPVAAAPAAPTEKLHTLKSPIVGTFYDSPAPGSPAFVKVGDMVEVGQVLCIVEAMKLMNEIESDIAGEIVERSVKVGAPVEYGQGLFCIRPR